MTAPVSHAAIGAAVRQSRIAAGLSQADLWHELARLGFPIEKSGVSRVESGSRALKLAEAAAIAEITGSTVTVLLGRAHAHAAIGGAA